MPCARGADAEQLAGTAAHEVTHLLIEHRGAWGRKAFAESDLPAHVRTTVAERADALGVRISLIRRHGRRRPETGFRVYGAHAAPGREQLGTIRLEDPEQLLDLDLKAWAQGRMVGLEPVRHPLLLVCTNGRRDTCCAEFGRPIVRELHRVHPEETWEITHLGGHRFAGAMLTLPRGFSYGRLDPTSALDVAARTFADEVEPAHLRGRVGHPQAVQVAEIHLLRETGRRDPDVLSVVEVVETDTGCTVIFTLDGEPVSVTVGREKGPAVRKSCVDVEAKTTTRWRVGV